MLLAGQAMESKGQDKLRAINGRTTGKNKVTKRSTEVDRATLKNKQTNKVKPLYTRSYLSLLERLLK